MIRIPTARIKGLTHLLAHPRQFTLVTYRELRFSQRNNNRTKWIKWQERDACRHIQLMENHPVELNNNLLHKARIKIILDFIANLDNGLDVLDVGCGNGAICTPIREKGNNVTCVELGGVAPLTHNCGIDSIIAGDAENLAFPSESFDLILASEVVEHLWDPKNFFKETSRILKPNGLLIISTPEGRMGLCYDSHKHYFTEKKLKQQLGKNFDLLQIKHLKPNGEPAPTIIASFRKSTTN